MPTLRQQRAPRNRRTLTRNNPSPQQTMVARITSLAGAGVNARFYGAPLPPTGVYDPLRIVLTGIPAWRRTDTSVMANSAVLQPDGVTVLVGFPGAAFTVATQIDIGTNDPAVRTVSGGYVAPGQIAFPSAPAPGINYGAIAIGTNDVTVNIDSGGQPDLVMQRTGFQHVESGSYSVAINTSQFTTVVSFGLPVLTGDSIVYKGKLLLSVEPSCCEPARTPVVTT